MSAALQSGIRSSFGEFFDNHKDIVQTMLSSEKRRLTVSIDEICQWNKSTTIVLMNMPFVCLRLFDDTLFDLVKVLGGPKDKPYHVGFTGNFGVNHLCPRSLNGGYLNKFGCVDGVVHSLKHHFIKLISLKEDIPENMCKDQVPCSIEVELYDDLVNTVKPSVVGVYHPNDKANTSSLSQKVFTCNNISEID